MKKKLVVVIPEELHRKLKAKAANTGQTIREIVIRLVRKEVEEKSD